MAFLRDSRGLQGIPKDSGNSRGFQRILKDSRELHGFTGILGDSGGFQGFLGILGDSVRILEVFLGFFKKCPRSLKRLEPLGSCLIFRDWTTMGNIQKHSSWQLFTIL